jgi:hypothetical protein
MPMDAVIEFKREVYQRALGELAPYLSRRPRGGARGRRGASPETTGAVEPG